VGAMMACYLAKRGYKVDIYERRTDIRLMEVVRGRSINLALSCRGREALRGVGLEAEISKNGIPMRARMIHDLNDQRRPIPYGTKDQYIMSIDRRLLNEVLLTAAEKYPNVRIFFSHKLVSCDFEKGEAEFCNEKGDTMRIHVDLIVGADGAYSSLRRQMMKRLFDYEQTYIPHGYMELNIPPNNNNEYAMETNYLHIWPRNEFMMIALPNLDKSFTTTLFMPFEIFESLDTEEKLMQFFEEKFPDSIKLIGAEALKKTFFTSKALPMVSIKCKPYHVGDKSVIIGDAAHSMVPFYGQGMNCVSNLTINCSFLVNLYLCIFNSKALPEYTKMRHPDATAMCDLAMYNYVEMRSHVNSKLFLLRKKMDNFLHMLFPRTWIPLYTMVSFTRTRYHQCISRRAWQDKVINQGITVSAVGGGVGLVLVAYWMHKSGSLSPVYDFVEDSVSKVQNWLKV
ncbi:hypothetical protein EGW08_021994, partial [Elysia chlorotica]